MRRASALVILGEDNDLKEFLHSLHPQAKIFDARYRLMGLRSLRDGRLMSTAEIAASRLIAFCGIADPSSFFSLLQSVGLSVCKQVAYPDHCWYTERDLRDLAAMKEQSKAEFVVTTEKDYVRIAHILSSKGLPLLVAECDLSVDQGFRDFILSTVRR